MAKPKIRKPRGAEQPILGPNGIKLKQIQYRSYMHDILIYHFQAYYISVHNFGSLLNRNEHGYVDTLLSFDPLLRLPEPMPEGDVVSEGCVEVVYMPNVFQHGGSALGFRMGDDVVEWMCFDQAIDDIILKKLDFDNPDPKGPRMLFDQVGSISKGILERKVRGANLEHRGWHDSLWKAEHRPSKLLLTWKNYGTAKKEQHLAERADYLKSLQEQAMEQSMQDMNIEDDGFADGDMLVIPEDDESEDDESEDEYESYETRAYVDGADDQSEEEREDIEGGFIYEDEEEEEEEEIIETPTTRITHEDKNADKNQMDKTLSKTPKESHSIFSPGPTVLGDKDTNKLLKQKLSLTAQKDRDKQFLNEGYN